jgi:prophage regulatory protein
MKSPRRIRLKEVMELVPLSASTIYKRMGEGTFPKSQNLGGGVVCWRESDILEWLDALPESNLGSNPGLGAENNLGVAAGVSEKKAA